MTTIQRDLIAAGYVRCANTQDRWYTGGPGIMEPGYPLEVRYADGHLSIVVNPYGKFNQSDAVDVLCFSDVADLMGYLAVHGRVSEPGLPAFSNSWD